jgi:hypothetical protein
MGILKVASTCCLLVVLQYRGGLRRKDVEYVGDDDAAISACEIVSVKSVSNVLVSSIKYIYQDTLKICNCAPKRPSPSLRPLGTSSGLPFRRQRQPYPHSQFSYQMAS